MSHARQKITVIGAGNVAGHLAPALVKKGYLILEIFSRSGQTARELAAVTGSLPKSFPDRINPEADIILLALGDDAIPRVLEQISPCTQLLVHTAGSVSSDVLAPCSSRYGVLYPLQTFSRNRRLELSQVPFFVEGNNGESLSLIKAMAESLSPRVIEADSETRLMLHIAAVFSSNFQNHLYRISEELLRKEGIPFSHLEPLLRETLDKAMEIGPGQAQTGPAVRRDSAVMEKHLARLSSDPAWQAIYRQLSENIQELNRNKTDK